MAEDWKSGEEQRTNTKTKTCENETQTSCIFDVKTKLDRKFRNSEQFAMSASKVGTLLLVLLLFVYNTLTLHQSNLPLRPNFAPLGTEQSVL